MISQTMLFTDRKPHATTLYPQSATYTISPLGSFYSLWQFILLLSNTYTSLLYPYYTVNGLPEV